MKSPLERADLAHRSPLVKEPASPSDSVVSGSIQMAFFKPNARKIVSLAQPMNVDVSDKTMTVTFSVVHKISYNSLDVVDGLPPEQQADKEKILNSYFKFMISREEESLKINLRCHSYPEILDMHVKHLFDCLCEKSDFGIVESSTTTHMAHWNFQSRILTMEPEFKELFNQIDLYNADCLGRFMELTENRDDEAFKLGKQVKEGLCRIRDEYQTFTKLDYDTILNGLAIIESHETFVNDPPTRWVYKPIRTFIETLQRKALLGCASGMQINEEQLDQFLGKLKESGTTGEQHWIPRGSVELLRTQIKSFLNPDIPAQVI